ncbi:MAG TPA: NAD-dependent epimerase/dehydratase family protein [Bryobacteraceae bacterium]|jgi:nucleoside-diphosphate-sugar epimerase|nr:NAD-dependent epimerase/dehydratase family protein [Bryobacteraceae bacterium]
MRNGFDEESSKRILVIGGTQFIGRVLVTELLHRGHEVYILHRSSRHPFSKRVHNLVGDRNNPASIRKAVAATRFDVVFDNVYDWEHGTTAAQVEATAQIFDGKISRYVFMSSVAAYGDGLNHHEGDALAPDDHPNQYARNKAMSERALFRLYQRTGFPVVTLRPPFVYGPGNPYYREAFFWDRFRAARPVILPSEGHRLMQFVFVKDLVQLAVRAMELRNAAGHAFNTANPRAITQHELLICLARVAGVKEPHVVPVPREFIHRLGGQAIGEKLYFGYYFDVPAITQIVTKAQRMLAFKPTDFEMGLKLTYRAYVKQRDFPRPDYAFEDELLNRFASVMPTPRTA